MKIEVTEFASCSGCDTKMDAENPDWVQCDEWQYCSVACAKQAADSLFTDWFLGNIKKREKKQLVAILEEL